MSFEIAILDFIRENLSCGAMDVIMKAITFLGNGGWFWIALGVILSFIPKTRRMGLTVCCALLFGLILCNLTLKPLVARTRPYEVVEGIKLIIPTPSDYSFPSGHTNASFAAAVAVFINDKKYGTAALILASLIAFSRLYLYVHFPTDILGGIVVGTVCAILAWYVVKTVEKKIKAKAE